VQLRNRASEQKCANNREPNHALSRDDLVHHEDERGPDPITGASLVAGASHPDIEPYMRMHIQAANQNLHETYVNRSSR